MANRNNRGRGRPRKDIDEQQVFRLALIGCTQEEIASVLGCSVDTLDRNFAESYARGKNSAKKSLRKWQFKRARAGSDRMLMWLGQQYLGQRNNVSLRKEDIEAEIERELAELARAGPEASAGGAKEAERSEGSVAEGSRVLASSAVAEAADVSGTGLP